MDHVGMDMSQLAGAYASKAISPVEHVRGLLAKIEERKGLNAFITVMADQACRDAEESERRLGGGGQRPLEGIPIAVKDIVHVKGVPCTFGCEVYRDFIPEADAFAVGKLREAGAVVIGKTNTSQFAISPMGDVSCAGPCRNPHDEERVSGGSSSGSAAALAAGLCAGAVGTDTGGSIRIPSSLCGCVGLKPTFSLVSTAGVMPLAPTMDVIGPMSRTVRDNAMLLNAMAGYNPRDRHSAPVPPQDYTAWLQPLPAPPKVAIDYGIFEKECSPEVRTVLDRALKAIGNDGFDLRPVSLDAPRGYRDAHRNILAAAGYHAHWKDVVAHPEAIFDQIRDRLCSGNLSADEYLGYEDMREKMRCDLYEALQGCDVIAIPSTPVASCRIGDKTTVLHGTEEPLVPLYSRYTWMANLSGFPAISIPAGLTEGDLPAGLSLLARPFAEGLLYQIAYRVEQLMEE